MASEAVHEECAGVGIRPVSLSTEQGERLDAAPPIAITEDEALSVMQLLPQGRLEPLSESSPSWFSLVLDNT
jgi:hypothetical protein